MSSLDFFEQLVTVSLPDSTVTIERRGREYIYSIKNLGFDELSVITFKTPHDAIRALNSRIFADLICDEDK